MKKIIKSAAGQLKNKRILILAIALLGFAGSYAQNNQSVIGKLIDKKSSEPVPYASVSLINTAGNKLVQGTLSDLKGEFKIGSVQAGSYTLLINFLGYKPGSKAVVVTNNSIADAGIIYLQDTVLTLGEAVVTSERVKAKTESNKTTFFMTPKMTDAAGTGVDVLKFIPGIQVDLMQNISLEGSRNILIFVDGRERDRSFVSQLSPGQIDKIEIISVPTAKYDGSATGAINIIMKKERNSGLNGQIYSEIPVTGSVVYLFPTFNINYNYKKLNLYTSYNGEVAYLDLHEYSYREIYKSSDTARFLSNQYVRQKNWIHRFNFGLDYFLSARDVINFYAYYNPYSRELDGNADLLVTGSVKDSWQARKEDTDINTSTFYSVYYKHNFKKEGSELTIDISNYHLRARNITEYVSEGGVQGKTSWTNSTDPRQNAGSVRIDFITPLRKNFNFSTGIKGKSSTLSDRYSNEFTYNETILAAYGSMAYKQTKFEISAGLRAERSVSGLVSDPRNSILSFLPNASFRYKLTARQNLQLSYNRSVRRPDISQLNPYVSFDDPYTTHKGNPFLMPEISDNINLDYSLQFKSNYLSSGLFYKASTNTLDNFTSINDAGLFETQVYNLGSVTRYGMKFSGSFKLGNATLNPSIQLFDIYTCCSTFAREYLPENRHGLAYESGLSALWSFKKDFVLSFVFQYNSPKNHIQGNSFSDGLYFISLDKTFKQKIKVGIGSGLPFTKSFVYQGSDKEASNFHSHYKGSVNISSVPLWLKLSYQFNSGKTRSKINRLKEEVYELPKKGF